MSQQVRKGEELNEAPLKSFLQAEGLIEHANSEWEVSQFSNGFSNLTYLLHIEGKEFVLRRPPFGAVKRGHDMSREYKILSKLYQVFPAPQAYSFTDDLAILGAPFYIMEYKEGIILSMKEAKKRAISPVAFETIADTWLNTFIQLHEVDYEAVGLGDLGRPNGYVERQVRNWGKQYLKAATREISQVQQIMTWMEENQPKAYEHSLIHNDYRYDNIVFADDTWKKVNAVLDWEMCTLGDPMMDLGTTLAYWTMSTDGPLMQQGIPSPTVLEGNPSRTELVEMYAKKSGRPIKHLIFYYVYGLFKLAVIAQQIYYRYAKGLTTDERFAKLDHAAEMLCFVASQAIAKKRIDHLV